MKNVEGERVLLVQRRLSRERSYLHELRELALAAGYIPIAEVEQIRVQDAAYQIGYGKALELSELIEKLGVDKVIFFNELKPVQAHNLSKLFKVDVIDRFQLILEIFAKRAGDKEAKLQIELARLRRELSFAKEYVHVAKREELPGFMGGGEYDATVYERHIRERISKINKELKRIRKRKMGAHKRRTRSGAYLISITGYTGAGKTSLFNVLTGENGYIDGKPFATLSTTIRRTRFNGVPVIISDTIGFIDSLPPLLIESFYTTLEEINNSDILIIVLDASEELDEISRKVQACLEVLETIGAGSKPMVVALNKIDLLSLDDVELRIEKLSWLNKPLIPISAKKVWNIDLLVKTILNNLPGYVEIEIALKRSDNLGSLVDMLSEGCKIVRIDNNRLLVGAKREWLASKMKRISKLGGIIVDRKV